MVFARKKSIPIETAIPAAEPTSHLPTIIEKLESELREKEELIRIREDEITTLNARAVALCAQIAWLKRTPQAIVILTSLNKRFSQ